MNKYLVTVYSLHHNALINSLTHPFYRQLKLFFEALDSNMELTRRMSNCFSYSTKHIRISS